jgi:hypothetical protein
MGRARMEVRERGQIFHRDNSGKQLLGSVGRGKGCSAPKRRKVIGDSHAKVKGKDATPIRGERGNLHQPP